MPICKECLNWPTLVSDGSWAHLALGNPGAKSGKKRENFSIASQLTREKTTDFLFSSQFVCLFKNRKCAGCSSDDESHVYKKWLIVVLFVMHRH